MTPDLKVIFNTALTDITPAIKKKITKEKWIEHSNLLKNIIKKTRNEDILSNLINKSIPLTKRLQESVKENKKFKDTLWSILNRELILLNYIDRQIEVLKENKKNKNEIWAIIADLSAQLTKESEMELLIINNVYDQFYVLE